MKDERENEDYIIKESPVLVVIETTDTGDNELNTIALIQKALSDLSSLAERKRVLNYVLERLGIGR